MIKVKKMKLTTRLIVSNIMLFMVLLLLIFFFVTLLTNQFLFYKNRDELLDKRQQVSDYLQLHKKDLDFMPPRDRIIAVGKLLDQINFFESNQFLVLVSNEGTLNSFLYKPQYYVNRISTTVPFEVKHLNLKTAYIPAKEDEPFSSPTLKVTILHSFDGADYKPLQVNHYYLPRIDTDRTLYTDHVLGKDYIYTTLMCDFPNDRIFISLFLNPDLDRDFVASLKSALIISSLMSIVVLSLLGKFFTRSALRPLVDLSYIAQNINNETLNYRIPSTDSNDEVDTLIKSLNLMLQNLETSFQSQQRFVSDASHELRIPLTVVLGYIDLLKTVGESHEDRGALLAESLNAIEEEAKNMNALVEKLLLIARLESKRFITAYQPINLLEFFKKYKYECERLYPDHHFVNQLDYKGNLMADRELFVQMIRALTENAVKYSQNGTITFISHETESNFSITVKDTGYGIPKEAIPHLANRFYRVDVDRNRTTGGSGLGLSIVNTLMKAHYGRVVIESEEGLGTKVTLHFPKESSKKLP